MAENPEGAQNFVQIEELLRSIRPEPGERFHQRMARAPWQAARPQPKGGISMNRSVRIAALAALALALIAGLVFTPAGSVLANEILHFFNRIQGNTLPLAPDQIIPPMPTPTPESTRALSLQPAEQAAAATPTSSPTPAFRPDEFEDMSLLAAKAAAGFDLYQPLKLPRDYRLTRISYDAGQQAVVLSYSSPQAGSGEFFQVTEGQRLEELSVGASARVETVPVGKSTAEFVRGAWFTYDGASERTWENEAEIYTLRWQAEDVTISIRFFLNDSFYPAYLEREEMLALAQDMARCGPADDSACPLQQAAAAAGFTPWQFPTLPDGLTFQRVDYRPGLSALGYGSDREQLTLLQSTHDFAEQETGGWSSVPDGTVQSLTVAGQPAEYVKGQFTAAPGDAQATWDADAPVARLRWKNGNFWFQIVSSGSQPGLEAQSMADLAATLTAGVDQARPNDHPTPPPSGEMAEALASIAAVQARVDFDVLEPGILPEGLAFSHARYEPLSGSVMLYYGNFAPDKIHASGPVLLVSEKASAGVGDEKSTPIDEYFPPEAIQPVTINGDPGQLITGMMGIGKPEPGKPTPTPVWQPELGVYILIWNTKEMSFSLHFDPCGRAARLTPEDMVKIAESLR